MDRLTSRSQTGCAVPSGILGDICLKMSFCDEYDFCDGCPVGKMIKRLCEYEDTGLTPKQIELMKKNIIGQQRNIVLKPKSGAKVFIKRVSENGLIINNVLYGVPILVNEYCGDKVKVRIVENIVTVFDRDTNEQIVWFDLYPHQGFNCNHTFHPYKKDEIIVHYGCRREDIAKAIKQINN